MDDLPVLEVIKLFPSNGVVAVKRVIDIVLSALGLIILSPLMIIVALAIKATSQAQFLSAGKSWTGRKTIYAV